MPSPIKLLRRRLLKGVAPFRNDVHVITGLDNPAARFPGPGNDHHRSMSALVSGTSFSGHGAGGASIDQSIAAKIGGDSRFRSLQLGVSQESFGESIRRKRSVLDAVQEDAKTLESTLGKQDQARLKLVTGTHSKMTGTIGDLYLTLADDVMGAGLKQFPTADRKLSGLVGA